MNEQKNLNVIMNNSTIQEEQLNQDKSSPFTDNASLKLFVDVGKALTSSLSMEEVLRQIMLKVNTILKPKHWSLFLLNQSRKELYFCIAQGEVSSQIRDIRLQIGEGISGWVAKEGKPVLVADVRFDKRFSKKVDEAANFQTKSILCVPLIARAEVLGVIELVNSVEDNEFSAHDLDFLTAIADFAAIAIANARNYKRIKELTLKDPLTVSFNTRFLHKNLDLWIENRTPFSLLFLDLDKFKQIVDQFGHKAGSDLLVKFAQFLAERMEEVEISNGDSGREYQNHAMVRYGGDEFILMLYKTGLGRAQHFAEKILADLKETSFEVAENVSVKLSASIGLAEYPKDAASKKELMILADHAMFSAKDKGRGRVMLAKELASES